jgi:DNA uptake protein ComE-like DNA-binding protein
VFLDAYLHKICIFALCFYFMRFYWFLFAFLSIGKLFAQEKDSLNEFLDRSFEQTLEDIAESMGEQELDLVEIQEDLNYLRENPVSLNKASAEDLQKIPFLSPLQIHAILHHRKKFGNFINLYELQNIEALDMPLLQKLKLYVQVAPVLRTPWSYKLLKEKGRHELTARYGRILETQEGYRKLDKQGNEKPIEKKYLGNPDKFFLRYRFAVQNRLSVGVTASEDQGEKMFKNPYWKYGFDFYSAHFFMRDLGFVKTLAVGDFHAEFGQGLTFWSGLGFGKTAQVLQVEKNASILKPYRSLNEYQYLRGLAMTLSLHKNLELTVLGSYRHKDAVVNPIDSTAESGLEESFSNFSLSNYHNTANSFKKRNQIQEALTAMYLQYKRSLFQMGFTGSYIHWNKTQKPDDAPYNLYKFSGNQNYNLGLDYRLTWSSVYLFGELAMSESLGYAILQGLVASLHKKVSLSLVYRDYAPNYHAFYARAFGESYDANNEKGIYLSVQIDFNSRLQWQNYLDFFRQPWLTYSVQTPGEGMDFLSQLNYNYRKYYQFYIKYRYKRKIYTYTETAPTFAVAWQNQHNFRLNITYPLFGYFRAQSRAETRAVQDHKGTRFGYVLLQDIDFSPKSFPVQAKFRYALIQTDDYDTRIYAYESDVPATFSIVPYYETSHRLYLMLKCKVYKGLETWLRLSTSIYNNKETLGSGYEEIRGNTKSEIKAYLRYGF